MIHLLSNLFWRDLREKEFFAKNDNIENRDIVERKVFLR